MKKQLLSLGTMLLVATFFLAISGCKKDNTSNGVISKNLLLVGQWTVQTMTLDGVSIISDSTSDFLTCDNGNDIEYTETFEYEPFYWSFGQDSTWGWEMHTQYTEVDAQASAANCTPIYFPAYEEVENCTGTWSLSSDENMIIINNFTYGLLDTWTIREIGPTDLKIEKISGGSKLEIRLKK
jgi:hypothetical protein